VYCLKALHKVKTAENHSTGAYYTKEGGCEPAGFIPFGYFLINSVLG
jgi:hypothetical protein